MIITYLGKDCKSYEREKWKTYDREWLCPECHGRAHIHCSYTRKVIELKSGEMDFETVKEIRIVRIKCISEDCGKTHAIIPDFLCPKKRYKAEDIEETIEIYEVKGNVKEVETTAEESTVRRWIKQYLSKIEKIIAAIEKILLKEHVEQVSLIDFEVKGMSRLKIIIDKFQEIKNSCKIGFLNQILSSNGLNIFL
jgi:hypothetical protein